MESKHFQQLVDAGHPIGEVVAVNNFLVQVRGLQPVSVHALVVFDDASKGFVQRILEDRVIILHLGARPARVGALAVVQNEALMTKVGKDLVGRAVSVTGQPLDGKGPIASDATWPVFNTAPPIFERELLATQLETGVTIVDALFPLVRGQRLALLGDSKSGKSTLAAQIAINQRHTDQIVVYVLIAKSKSQVDNLLVRLTENDALKNTVVIVSTVFESLAASYLAPYVGCSVAEYFWQELGQDTLIIYDDLTTHAHIYREIALLSGVSPGRDSYPGDMFYAHSSLLERAGRLSKNHKCLTAIPLVLAAGGDITAYLPTNLMSITDGQWVLSLESFREGWRPALDVGLSVTSVGGPGQNARQKAQTAKILQTLAVYREASEFSHFATALSANLRQIQAAGQRLQQLFLQAPAEAYSVMAQQLMIDVILSNESVDVAKLKSLAPPSAAQVKDEAAYAKVLAELVAQLAPAPAPGVVQ